MRVSSDCAHSLRSRSNAATTRPELLLSAARRLEPVEPELSRETYLEALSAAIFAGRLSRGRDTAEVAKAVRAAPQPPQPLRAIDLLLDGLAVRFTDGYAAAARPLERALEAFRADDTGDTTRWLWLACRVAAELWDLDTWQELTTRQMQLARDAGALTVLPLRAASTAPGATCTLETSQPLRH